MKRGRVRRAMRRMVVVAIVLVAIYVVAAYVVLPRLWTHYEHNPRLADLPMVTRRADGIPGDPINVGLVGSEAEAIRALTAAGWFPADPVTLKTSVEIVGSVLLDRPFRDAPVSPLFYEGRKQAFAFEKPVGESADRRNHVRFWQTLAEGKDGRPLFLGSATFDRGVGVSHDTGEITHHIAADIDAERMLLIRDLASAGMLSETYQVTGVGPTLFGRNGGGDPYYTDGEVTVGVLTQGAEPTDTPPKRLPNPPVVDAKNALFARARSLAGDSSPPP
jgi:hypothetical protein